MLKVTGMISLLIMTLSFQQLRADQPIKRLNSRATMHQKHRNQEVTREMDEKILKFWFEGFNRRDWVSLKEIYSEDALIHGKDGPLKGGEGVVTLGEKWLEAIPDAKVTPLYTSTEEDVVVVHWRIEGTFTKDIRGMTATGNKTVFHGLTCFRCLNDKVIEHWASVDYRPLLAAS